VGTKMGQNETNYVDVFLPVYAKADTIRQTLEKVTTTLRDDSQNEFRFVLVLDGPDETTKRQITAFPDRRVTLLELPANQGKGAALRKACHDLRADLTVFMDADLDIDPSCVLRGIREFKDRQDTSLACAYGSKIHHQSIVNYPPLRRILSEIFRRLIRLALSLDVEDTQTGVKVFRSSRLSEVVGSCKEKRFLFDVELLTLLTWRGGSFVSIPIKLDYAFNSSIRIRDVLRMGIDTSRLLVRMQASRMRYRKGFNE
jgi:glycosyltransferase involved in cell wall biosynthesis